MPSGKVWLVGAGPGNPGLITIKGAKALETAEAVVYDRLANPALLDLAPQSCQRLYAGKVAGGESSGQEEINDLLIRLASEGKRVVRLKGGDPFILAVAAKRQKPSRTPAYPSKSFRESASALAVPAYAGIPVTHRGIASSFAVFTGHEDPSKPETSLRWDQLAAGPDTIVGLMGVSGLEAIAARLIAAGKSEQTPAAAISCGTYPRQRVVIATLADIAQKAVEAGLVAPAVMIVGDVVQLRERLRWFESRPLFGKRVLITRTREQASGLRSLLEEQGAEVLELPTLEIVDGASPQLLARVIDALADGEYAWVLFTSANGVRRFFRAVADVGRDARVFHQSKVAVVGPATADALLEYGIRADAMPEQYEGQHLGNMLAGHELSAGEFYVPRAEVARPELIQILRTRGAEVEEIPLYSSEVPRNPNPDILAAIRSGSVDVVTFASSSAVRNLAKMLGTDFHTLKQAVVACIGPSTAEAAVRCGITPAIVADDHTIPGLVTALNDYFLRESSAVTP